MLALTKQKTMQRAMRTVLESTKITYPTENGVITDR